MSNCLQPVQLSCDLDPAHFLGLKAAEDTDGNEVAFDEDSGVWYIKMGATTTWREFRAFLWDHVQPYVRLANVRIPFKIREESDGFEEVFIATVKLFPPGTTKTAENFRRIF